MRFGVALHDPEGFFGQVQQVDEKSIQDKSGMLHYRLQKTKRWKPHLYRFFIESLEHHKIEMQALIMRREVGDELTEGENEALWNHNVERKRYRRMVYGVEKARWWDKVIGHHPMYWARKTKPLYTYILHLNKGLMSLPVMLPIFFDDASYKRFAFPGIDTHEKWNACVERMREYPFWFSARVMITEVDFLAWCERKGARPESVEARGRFLVRTVNAATLDELRGRKMSRGDFAHHPDPDKPVSSIGRRPKTRHFDERVIIDPSLGPVYVAAMIYATAGADTFDLSGSAVLRSAIDIFTEGST